MILEPRISVALCTYNGESFLREQLDSFSAQTQLPDELVVCDDGSSDGTIRLLEEYAEHAPFSVSIHRNPTNLGSNQNFGLAISRCKGDIIFLSDQDDVWRPDKVATVMAEFARYPAAGLVFSNARLVDDARQPLRHRLWETVRFQPPGDKRVAAINLFSRLTYEYLLTGATMAVRKEYLAAILPIADGWVHDGWIAYIVSALADPVAIDEDLIDYRQHPRQQIGLLPVRTILGYRPSATFGRIAGIAYEMLFGSPSAAIEADLTNALVRYGAARERLQMIDDNGRRDADQDAHQGLSNGLSRVRAESLALLDDHLMHLNARRQIRSNNGFGSRIKTASDELRRGGYHRSGLGWLSFGRDVVGL